MRFKTFTISLSIILLTACGSTQNHSISQQYSPAVKDPKTQYKLGSEAFFKREYTEAAQWFRLSAEQGYAEALYAIGSLYEKGEGVEQDYNEAEKWYYKAVQHGDNYSTEALGLLYEKMQNYAEAAKWYRKASDIGYNFSKYKLGMLYYTGKGVKQDKAIAKQLFTGACALNKYSVACDFLKDNFQSLIFQDYSRSQLKQLLNNYVQMKI